MKWFLDLGPCWGAWGGAATVTPAADGGSISTPTKQEEATRAPASCRRRRSKYKATVHWKPKLHAILEDNNNNSLTITLNNNVDVGKLGQHMTMTGIFKKQSLKIKHLIKAKVTKPSYKEDCTSAYPHYVTVVPFSPTPFLL